MVEITYQMVLSTLQTVGLLMGIVYYLIIMRNSQRNQELALKAQEQALETRQAALFMQLFSIYDTREFLEDFGRVAYLYDYEDLADWQTKYGPLADVSTYSSWSRVGRYFDGVGILLKKKLIDPSLVTELLREIVIVSWEAMSTWVYEIRDLMNTPEVWENFEYLYREVRERHPNTTDQIGTLTSLREMVETEK